METDWMGRYRPLIAALVQHTNSVNKTNSYKYDIGDGIQLNHVEWQILETVIENSNNIVNMSYLSDKLGIPQSTFSRTVTMLEKYRLIEKFQAVNNKKNIILKPTQYGVKLYKARAERFSKSLFQPLFDDLKSMSDENLQLFVKAIEDLNNNLEKDEKKSKDIELIKIST